MNTSNKILLILAFIASFSAMVFLIIKAFDVSEVNECRRWAEDAGKYTGYYIVKWQEDQCFAHQIFVTNVVK